MSESLSPAEPTLDAPLNGSTLKVQRARKLLAELEKEIADHLATNPATFRVSIPEKPQDNIYGPHLVMVEIKFDFKAVPSCLGPIVGDVIHNLRSSLDLMACELVRHNKQDDTNVKFPFCKNPDDLDKIIKRQKFDRASAPCVDLLKLYKPHKGGNAALWALHELDLQDKHHTIIPTPVAVGSPVLAVRDDHGRSIWPEIVGDAGTPSSIAFVFPPDSVLAGKELVPALHEFVDLVAGIIEAFAALNSHPASSNP